MERSLPAMLFLVASIAFSVALGGWWMQRVVFTPDATRDTAAAILREPEIRQDLNSVISTLAAPALEADPGELGIFLENVVLSTRAGATELAPIIERAHERVIGLNDDPLRITGIQLVPIVRDQRAVDVEAFTVPLETIGSLKTSRNAVGWVIPISAAIGLLTLAAGVFLRPERRDVMRALGEFLLALAVSILIFGYLIPVHFFTAIDNRTWTKAIPRLALRTLPVVLGMALIFVIAGVVLIVSASSGNKRRQWSTPLSVARYRGGQNPGWG